MPTAGSLPTTHVYASIGLDLESPLVADTSFRWGGEERFYQAVAREVNAEKCWEKWGHLTRNKKTAPFAVWCIFAPGSKGRAEFKFADKERKVKERIALAKTALAFDIDGGNVSAQSLELALLGLGWESAFYTTWKAREDALRWRVVIPLATPHTVEGWDDFYSQKLTEFQKALEVHHGSLVAMDLSAKVFVQAHILPHEIPSMFLAGMTTKKLSDCLSIMEGHKDSVPGFACAKVFGTRGVALTHSSTFILSDGARRTLSPALFAGKGQVQRGGKPSPKPTERFVDIVEYRGNGSGEKAADTAKGWRVLGVKNVPSLAHGLDGAQYFAECGIHAARGHRRDALVGACWHLHRVGWGHAEIMKLVDQMIAKSKNTDQKHLTEAAQAYLSKELIPLEKEAKVMEAAIFAAISDKSSKLSDATRKHFARILSRAKHCYEPKGGKLCQEQIAICLGLPSSSGSSGVKAIRAMLGDCERAGLLITAGEYQQRRYRLIPSDTKKVEATS